MFGSEVISKPETKEARLSETLSAEAVRRFLALYRHVRGYARQMHSQGVSGRKISLLRHLFEAGPRTIGQLGDYLYISDSSTSELVSGLEEEGFVTRTRSSEDNRVVIVTLAPAGRSLAQEPPSGGIPLLREKLKTLPPERLTTINEVISEMMELLGIEYDR